MPGARWTCATSLWRSTLSTDDDRRRDQRLYDEISEITNDYGALHRRSVRDLARSRVELTRAHAVLGTVAHDLRTPLSTVAGFIELLLADEALSDDQRELGERVERAARTMAVLVEELVETVTAGGAPLRSDPVDLSSMVRNVIARHQLLQPPRGVRVVADNSLWDDTSVVVLGDEGQLERMLDNVVSNALKFSPDEGEVRVRLAGEDDHAELRVSDDGPGIPADQLDQIFTPFHRAPGAAAVPGVGLGLTIVKELVQRHGGQVHVESVLGEGATFVVRLPRRRRPRSSA